MTHGIMATGVGKDTAVQGNHFDLFRHPSSMNAKKQPRRNGVQRTNTVLGVTDQARRILEELLAREPHSRRSIKREIPLSEPIPRLVVVIGENRLQEDTLPAKDLVSPISVAEFKRAEGGRHKRPPSNGTSTVLEDSSPSPLEIPVPDEITTRKKKSFFVRAKERLRESIRRQAANPLTPSDERAESERNTGDKNKTKKTWSLLIRKKKEKRKESKENVNEAIQCRNKLAFKFSNTSSLRSKDSSNKELNSRNGVQSLSSRTSLPSDRLASVDSNRTAAPTRSRSTDETRIRSLRPEDEEFIRSHIFKPGDRINGPTSTSSKQIHSSKIQFKNGNHSLRKNLHLEGLVSNYPTTLPHQPSTSTAPLAFAEDSRITPSDDDVDGVLREIDTEARAAFSPGKTTGPVALRGAYQSWDDRPLIHATSKPFSEKSLEERSELFGRIADQLDIIGDSYCFGQAVTKRTEENSQTNSMRPSEFEMRRAASTSSLTDIANVVSDLARNTTYDTFQRLVNRTVGSEPGIEQIGAMFRLTKCAVSLAGSGTTAAGKIKEMSIRYFAEHFAGWMVDEGGWESVVEDSATDMELD